METGGQFLLNDKEMSLADIVATVRERLRHDPQHPVFVQPDDALPLQQLVTVLDRLENIAGARVSLTKEISTNRVVR